MADSSGVVTPWAAWGRRLIVLRWFMVNLLDAASGAERRAPIFRVVNLILAVGMGYNPSAHGAGRRRVTKQQGSG
jgi:hypothetical protein